MIKTVSRAESREKRHSRIRRKVHGTAERPRMAIMVSGRNIYVQLIDDERGATVASATSIGIDGPNNIAKASLVGKRAGEAGLAKGVKDFVVDRGGFRFHGRVKALVDAAISAGLSCGTKKEAK